MDCFNTCLKIQFLKAIDLHKAKLSFVVQGLKENIRKEESTLVTLKVVLHKDKVSLSNF